MYYKKYIKCCITMFSPVNLSDIFESLFFFKGLFFFRVLRGTSVATTKWRSRNHGTLSNRRHWRCTTPWRGHFTPSVVLKAEAMPGSSERRKNMKNYVLNLDPKMCWHDKRNFRDARQGSKLGIAEDQIPSIRDSKHQIAKSFGVFDHSRKSFKCLWKCTALVNCLYRIL